MKDGWGRTIDYMRISITDRCNLRCRYCMPDGVESVPRWDILSLEEIQAAAVCAAGLGIRYIKITGGEPLLSPGLEMFMDKVKEMGYLIKLDTNGSNVNRLKYLADRKLIDYVAMDIKNIPEKYGMTIGIEDYNPENVIRSAEYLLSGAVPYEFRTTVVREFHKRDDFEGIGRWLKGAEKYYLQSFADSGDVIQPGLRAYTKDILEQALAIVRKYIPGAELRGVD